MENKNTCNKNRQNKNEASTEDACRGWHSRGYLPHFDGGEIPQFITFRLFDSLPATLLDKWKNMFEHIPKKESDDKIRDRIEEYLDHGHGRAWLREPSIANIVRNALLYHDGTRYYVHSWVIMPNHVHVLLTPDNNYGIPDVMHSLKSFTFRENHRQGRWMEPSQRLVPYNTNKVGGKL